MQSKLFWIFIICMIGACSKKQTSSLAYTIHLTNNPLWAVSKIHDSVLFAGGGLEFTKDEIYKRIGAATSWQNPKVPSTFNKAIHGFLSLSNGSIMAFGISGYMAFSTDTGNTWVYHQLQSYKDIKTAVQVGNHIILGCNPNGNGSIALLDINGNSLLEKNYTIGIRCVGMANDSVGYATSTGAIQITTDGCFSWNFTNAKGDIFTSCIALANNDCIVCGYDGSIQRTTNAGATWVNIKTKNTFTTTYRWNKIIKIFNNQAFVIGDAGKMATVNLLTNTYEIIPSFTDADLLDACVKNANTISIVTSNGDYSEINL